MTSLLQCEVCGTAITPGPLGDVCPVCLLREGHTDFLRADAVTPSGAETTAFQDRAGLPRVFGNYELLEEIAHGGMGIVYRARQPGLNREVALKLLLAGTFASAEFVRRFQREAASAASLRHPNIVGVYEVGEVDGQPFLAMEYVAGRTLAELVRQHPLPPRDAARYLETVARAVQYAHDHGLLHRDLKPSNVLVDLDGQPRVTDFGLAKQMDGSTDLTVTGQMLGSPNYLSPEAALGRENQLTPASDVYSLGATLYHLLTGRPPLLAGSLAETLVQVREETAVAPRLLNPALPRDLETICLKCLEKEPGRRYAAARELADDLARWMRREPVHARPATVIERLWKWARRRPAQAALAGVSAVAVAALVVTSLWFNIHLTRARNESERNRRLSETNRLAAEAGAAASRAQVIRMRVLAGNRLMAEGDPSAAALWFAEALAGETQSDSNIIAELPHRRRLAAAWQSAPHLIGRLSPDDPVWRATFEGDPDLLKHPRFRAEWMPDGGLKLFRSDGTAVRFIDPGTAGLDPEIVPASRDARIININTPGTALLVFARDESQRVWDLDTGHPLCPALPGDGYGVLPRFNPDGGSWIRIRHESGRWLIESRQVAKPSADPVVVPVNSHLFEFQFDPEGRRFATAHWDGSVRLWSASSLKPDGATLYHTNGVNRLAFSPDGSRLATIGWGNEVRVWSVPDGRSVVPPLNRGLHARSLYFSRDGRFLSIRGADHPAWIWDLFVTGPTSLEGLASATQWVVSNGRGVVAAWDDRGRVHFWKSSPSGLVHHPGESRLPGSVSSVELTQDGKRVLAAYADGTFGLWNVDSGELVLEGQAGTRPNSDVAFSLDGKQIAMASPDGFVRRFESDAGREILPALQHGGGVYQVAFSPDGARLATCGDNRLVKVWNATSGSVVGEIQHSHTVLRVSFNPSGTRLLTAMADGSSDPLSAHLWDAVTLAPVGTAMEHADGVVAASFFAGGSRILTAGEDGQARVWDAVDGRPRSPWIRCGRRIFHVEASPDALSISTLDENRTLRLWDAGTGELLSSVPDCDAFQATFVSTDLIVYGGGGHPIRSIPLPVAAGPPDEMVAWSRFVAGRESDITGGLVPVSEEAHEALWTRLRELRPERFTIQLFDPAWHRQEMARAVRNGNAFAERFHRRMLESPPAPGKTVSSTAR